MWKMIHIVTHLPYMYERFSLRKSVPVITAIKIKTRRERERESKRDSK